MDAVVFSEWLATFPVSGRIRVLARIYSNVTVATRQLFLPDMPKGKEQTIISMLHGVNEVHHTLANWLTAYTTDENKAFPVQSLGRQLFEIATQYRIEGLLDWAIDSAHSHTSTAPPTSK